MTTIAKTRGPSPASARSRRRKRPDDIDLAEYLLQITVDEGVKRWRRKLGHVNTRPLIFDRAAINLAGHLLREVVEVIEETLAPPSAETRARWEEFWRTREGQDNEGPAVRPTRRKSTQVEGVQ